MYSSLKKGPWDPRDELICPIELLIEALFHAGYVKQYCFGNIVISSVIRQMGESQNGCFKKTRNTKFPKIWLALFSWNTRFEIRPFALLPTIYNHNDRVKCLILCRQLLLVSQQWKAEKDYLSFYCNSETTHQILSIKRAVFIFVFDKRHTPKRKSVIDIDSQGFSTWKVLLWTGLIKSKRHVRKHVWKFGKFRK